MMMKSTTSLLAGAALMFAGHSAPVSAELTTEYLASNGQNFTCTVLRRMSPDPNAEQRDVVLLHGFPFNKEWWHPLLEYWDNTLDPEAVVSRSGKDPLPADVSLRAVACDLRGYSPGASPDNIEEYTNELFAQDVYGIADAMGFDQGFHLAGHDHGAGLGWYMAANNQNNRVLSYAAMAVPHPKLFANAICGDNQVQDQIVAANYFNQFSLKDSAYANEGGLYKLYKVFLGLSPDVTQEEFQKWLWWYVAMEKIIALPKVVSDEEVAAFPGMVFFINAVRDAIPLEATETCQPKEVPDVGRVEVPTVMICGSNDQYVLCSDPYTQRYSEDLLPNFEQVNFDCAHNFFTRNDCSSDQEVQAVMDRITDNVLGRNSNDGSMEGLEEQQEASAAGRASLHISMAVLAAIVGSAF